jgi:hypothetical protein
MTGSTSLAVVHGAFDYTDEAGSVTRSAVNWCDAVQDRRETGVEFIERTMRAANRICISTALLRREVIADQRFDQRDGGYADMVLWLRIAQRGDIAYLHHRMAGIAVHGDSDAFGEGWYGVDDQGRPYARMTSAEVALIRANKARFLSESVTDRRVRRELAGQMRKHARHELKMLVAEKRDDQEWAATIRDLARSLRIEPSLLATPWPFVLAVPGAMGRSAYHALVASRSRD